MYNMLKTCVFFKKSTPASATPAGGFGRCASRCNNYIFTPATPPPLKGERTGGNYVPPFLSPEAEGLASGREK